MVPCPSLTCACCFFFGPGDLLFHWFCPLRLPLGLPCLGGPPLWVGLFCSGFCPLVSFLQCWWLFAGLFAPWFGRLGLPTPWSRLFPLAFHLRCSWRAFVVGCCCGCCCCPLVLRCLFGGSSDQMIQIITEMCRTGTLSANPQSTSCALHQPPFTLDGYWLLITANRVLAC